MKSKMVFKIAAIIFGVFAIISVGKGIMWYNWSHLTAQQKAIKITERMTSRLDLTVEQKEKVLAVNLEKTGAFEGRDFWKNQRHEHHRKSNSVYQEWRNEMKEILTDEQEEKMKL